MVQFFVAQQAATPTSGILASFLPIVLIIGIFYLLIYRPMKTRQRKLEEMIRNLKNGDKVITNGGIYGTVAGIRENTLLLRVADQVKIEVAKNAISGMQPPGDSN